ncbi:MAG TPA: 4Fe-4S dicluster domain-containing protein, partial [Candidatus Polarisedimenticolia bacterium]|nr:4Fe-4S dicluster domain-containing protein [Candidatus Polarisedimenticolia bacterium]
MSFGLLFDATRCIGCGACSAACKEQNDLPMPIEAVPTAYTWTVVQQRDGVNVRRLCMHCLTPTCVSVCPVGALSRRPEGPVVYDGGKCIGCRYCIMACPFGVPKYQWDRVTPVVGKCILCAGRVARGEATACASVCPTGATLFGERDDLVRQARERIAAEPDRYVDHIYGLEEAGGTAVLMLSGVPFESLGLKTDLPRQPLPLLTWQVLSKVPDFVLVAGAFLFGIHWITARRDEVARHAADAEADIDAGAGPPPDIPPEPA